MENLNFDLWKSLYLLKVKLISDPWKKSALNDEKFYCELLIYELLEKNKFWLVEMLISDCWTKLILDDEKGHFRMMKLLTFNALSFINIVYSPYFISEIFCSIKYKFFDTKSIKTATSVREIKQF